MSSRQTFEISRLSSKGQIVIPNSIRKKLKISDGIKIAVLTDGENILLKPIQQPEMEIFNGLIKRSRKLIKNINLKQNDITGVIKRVRSR